MTTPTVEQQLETAIKDIDEARTEFHAKIKEIGIDSDHLSKLDKKLAEVSEKCVAAEAALAERAGSDELKALRDELEGLETKLKRPIYTKDGNTIIDPDSGKPINELPDYGFKNIADIARAVRFKEDTKQIQEMNAGECERKEIDVANQPGVMVPTRFAAEIGLMEDPFEQIVRKRAQVIPAGTPPDGAVTLPALDQDDATGKAWTGGITVTWISEGGTKADTDADFREITLTPNEVAASIVITDKMLRNNAAVRPIIDMLLRKGVDDAEDQAFISGSGTGQPQGYLGDSATITVLRDTVSALNFADIVNLLTSGFINTSAVWVMQQALLADLITMAGPSGNLSYIWIENARDGVAGRLLGYPVVFTDKAPAAYALGDVSFCDFSKYLIKDGSGPFISASEHVNFLTNKTVVKVFWNVDGKPWASTTFTARDGSTELAPFVRLKNLTT